MKLTHRILGLQQLASDAAKECAAPPPFFPNSQYDLGSTSGCPSGADLDLLNIESAMFRLLTAQSHRVYQNTRLWCFGKTVGRAPELSPDEGS